MKLLRNIIMLLLFFVSFCPVFAIDGKIVLFVDDSFSDRWFLCAAAGLPLYDKDQLFTGQMGTILITFGDIVADKDNTAKITYDIKITDPDGKPMIDNKDVSGMERKLDPEDLNQLFVCGSQMDISFDPPDKKGKYLVSVVLKDTVSGKQKEIRKTIENSAFELKEYFKDNDKELEGWLDGYDKNPCPEKAIDALIKYSKKGYLSGNSFAPSISFFSAVFDSNPFLMEHLLNAYAKQDKNVKTDILKVFAFMKKPPKEFLGKLGLEEKNSLKGIEEQKKEMPDMYGKITSATQLDMLWGEFFATGKYKPLRKIAEALDYYGYFEKGSKFKKDTNPPKTKEDKEALYYYSIFGAAMWSIGSNCRENPLVKGYFVGMLKDKEVSKTAKSCIATVLKDESSKENGKEPSKK